MRVREHIDKISWSFGDRTLYVLYGLVLLVQINALEPEDWGLFFILNSINTWIFIVSDAFALQGVIQFGVDEKNRSKVNSISLILYSGVALGVGLLIFSLKSPLADFFLESRIENVGEMLPLFALLTIPRTFAIKLLYRDHLLKKVFSVDFVFFGSMTLLTYYFISNNSYLNFYDMVYIYFGGSAISSLFAILLVRKKLKFSLNGDISIKQFLSFGTPLMLQGTVHSLPRILDVLIMQRFFSLKAVGIYGLAKTLYRVFDVSGDAAYGLVYPSAVKLIGKNNNDGLRSLITKSVSFMLIVIVSVVVLFEAGLSEIIINSLLPEKYYPAIGQFNLLILAALAIPFIILSLVITASGKPERVLKFVVVSLALSLITFYMVGLSGNEYLIPLGIIIYNFSFGILTFWYIKRNFGFPVNLVFRAFGDSISYFKELINMKKKVDR